MRTVTIKQQQQMTKEIEEQLGNGRLNYLKVVNDYCYWMGWKVMNRINIPRGQYYSHTNGIIRNRATRSVMKFLLPFIACIDILNENTIKSCSHVRKLIKLVTL
ncbi:hypothetical protein RMATCC62417_06805 [Rhizopus microsporus]|nr:hypothetical protein RMATCC62417_06805 [Rhizopus microsporus]